VTGRTVPLPGRRVALRPDNSETIEYSFYKQQVTERIQTRPCKHLNNENCHYGSGNAFGDYIVEDEIVPAVMFIGLTVVFGLFFWFRYRMRSDMQQTIRTAIDKGQELTPELIDRLGNPRTPKDKDLRLALIWLALAIGLALCGFFVPDPSGHAQQGTLAGAAFPFAIGVAYLIMWRFTERDS